MKKLHRKLVCKDRNLIKTGIAIFTYIILILIHIPGSASSGDKTWMIKGKYGIFMHYQYRILLGYAYTTKPQYPEPSEMSSEQWNKFVDGFDVNGFASQMAEARVGWVIFCMDCDYFGWQCSPNMTFDQFTGYAPGQRCSNRDLIADLSQALHQKGVRLIVYYAGMKGYPFDKQSFAGTSDSDVRPIPPSAEARKKHIEILKEYCDRYRSRIDGWWFDMWDTDEYYNKPPDDFATIGATVHAGNPNAIIAFAGHNQFSCHNKEIDDFTGGDISVKVDLKNYTPFTRPADGGILWHGKIFCGNVYHGLGFANQYTDQELIDWVNTCNHQGGVVTMDWPFDPKTGLLKDFGFAQLKRIAQATKSSGIK
jgi:hypothetical protein